MSFPDLRNSNHIYTDDLHRLTDYWYDNTVFWPCGAIDQLKLELPLSIPVPSQIAIFYSILLEPSAIPRIRPLVDASDIFSKVITMCIFTRTYKLCIWAAKIPRQCYQTTISDSEVNVTWWTKRFWEIFNWSWEHKCRTDEKVTFPKIPPYQGLLFVKKG